MNEEKRKAEEAEEKRLAENAEARELSNLAIHISNGGSYAFIGISDIDSKLFSGMNCSEILGLKTSLKPSKTGVGGYVINGTNGRTASISNVNSYGVISNYKMPNSCNIFAAPAQVESRCGLQLPLYVEEIYERDRGTNIVTKFGRLKSIGGDRDKDTWKVILDTDGNSLRSRAVIWWTDHVFQNRPLKLENRGYLCRN